MHSILRTFVASFVFCVLVHGAAADEPAADPAVERKLTLGAEQIAKAAKISVVVISRLSSTEINV